MDASIIIATRNTCTLTGEAIQSVLAGTDSLECEIFVVDNGSTDGTGEVLSRQFPPVKLIRSEKNLGFARAVNLAAKKSTGEFLLLLNSDARPEPGALAKAVEWMNANPDCAVAGAQLFNPTGTRQNSIANFPTLATELLNKSLLRRLWPQKYPGKEQIYTAPKNVETVIGAFMLIRKTVWDILDGLDERFFFFFEETDFCLQASRKGFRIVHLPNVRVGHGQGQTAKQVSIGARIEHWRSRYLYFAKNHWPMALVVLTVGLLSRLILNSLASGFLVVVTLGKSERWRARRRVCFALVSWHLHGCPTEMGLPR